MTSLMRPPPSVLSPVPAAWPEPMASSLRGAVNRTEPGARDRQPQSNLDSSDQSSARGHSACLTFRRAVGRVARLRHRSTTLGYRQTGRRHGSGPGPLDFIGGSRPAPRPIDAGGGGRFANELPLRTGGDNSLELEPSLKGDDAAVVVDDKLLQPRFEIEKGRRGKHAIHGLTVGGDEASQAQGGFAVGGVPHFRHLQAELLQGRYEFAEDVTEIGLAPLRQRIVGDRKSV